MAEDWKSGKGQRIERLYAWVATEPDGGEGVLGSEVPGLGFMPLVGADKARMESYRPYAQAIRATTGFPVVLKVFGAGVVIDQLKPSDG